VTWVLVLVAWLILAVLVALVIGRAIRIADRRDAEVVALEERDVVVDDPDSGVEPTQRRDEDDFPNHRTR
jgi:hypothetical protein